MSKVKCAAYDCKYNSDKNICTAKDINLGWTSCMTLWDGRQEFWKCRNFEMSEESRMIKEKLDEIGKDIMHDRISQV